MTNRKNIVIITVIVGILVFLACIGFVIFNSSKVGIKESTNSDKVYEEKGQETIDFLNSIAGVKAENIEVINNPVVGFRGEIFANEDSILNGINYYLEKTKNDKMKNLEIDIDDDSIDIYVNYAVKENINTPIKVSVTPSLNNNKDLIIDIREVKFLDLKIADFIVNLALKTFVKDWFNDSNIKVEYGKNQVIIYGENFAAVNLEALSLKNNGINLELIIDIAKLFK